MADDPKGEFQVCGEPFAAEPVVLSYGCGKPLQLAKTTKGRWVIGDFEATRGPLVHGHSAEAVLTALVEELQAGTL